MVSQWSSSCLGTIKIVLLEQKYINTVQKSVKSSEAQRNADAAKSRKMAAKEVKTTEVTRTNTYQLTYVC